MTATASSAIGRLCVERAHVEVLLSREHPAPERVRARFDDVASKRLASALAHAVSAALSTARPGIWLFRRLSVAFDANVEWDADVIAEAWCEALGRSVRACLATRHGDDVQWFPDRAALVARFAADLARDVAWGRWVYARFAGLRALPRSAALRTAILGDAQPWSVLAAVAPEEIASVCAALTTADAARVLAGLDVEDGGGELAGWAPIAQAFAAEIAAGAGLLAEARLALHVSARAARGGARAPGLAAGARAAARLARVVLEAPPGRGQEFLAAVRRGELAGVARDGGTSPDALAPLARAGEAARRALADALAVHVGARPSAGEAETDVPAVRHTTAGGVFLLLPLLDELPLEEATAGWPDCEDSDAAAVLRLLVLAQALGGSGVPAAVGDPLVRDLAGVGPRAHAGSLGAWSGTIPRAALRTFAGTLASWGLSVGALGAEALVLARAPLGVGHELVLLDGARGLWIALGALGRRSSGRLPGWLRRAAAPFAGGARPRLFLDDGLGEAATALPGSSTCAVAAAAAAGGTAPSTLGDVVARLPALADDLAYLALPRAWGLARPLSAALTTTTQSLLRAFAWRVPGFAHASLRYLHANFLDVRAALEDEPDRRIVRLGSAPLHLVLATTGMARATYRLHWTDARPFALFPSS